MSYQLSRRNFMKISAGASLTIALNLQTSNAESAIKSSAPTFTPSVWLDISVDDKITVTVAESEMGQGVLTTLSMMVVEELDGNWSNVSAIHADADMKYGQQVTGGSTSLRENWDRLRMTGAAARLILIQAAANKWNINTSQCRTSSGIVSNTLNDKQYRYGDLIESASKIKLPQSVTLKTKDQFNIIGKALPRLDSPIKVNGKAKYGHDIIIEGALTATVIHPPIIDSEVEFFDDSITKTVKGVKEVVKIKQGIAVVAENFWAAKKGAAVLKVKWKNTENKNINSQYIKQKLDEIIKDQSIHDIEQDKGDAQTIISSAGQDIVEAEFFLPYQAHASMEPMTCTAYVNNGECEVWTPTQSPTWAKDEARAHSQTFLSRLTQKFIKPVEDSVKLHNTMIGGSFGRRIQVDYVSEAVQISAKLNKPIRLIWEREQDIKNDYYHPATLHSISAKLDEQGMPVAWWHQSAGQKLNFGGAYIPYDIPNIRIQGKRLSLPIKIGPWRSVSHYYNAFVVESFIDALAAKNKFDPVEYRLKLLKDPQMINVLQEVAKKAKWGQPLTTGHYHGVATHKGFGSYVAQVVEVSIRKDGSVKVHKIVAAIDAGIVVNPDTVIAQMESAIVFGLSAALKGEVTFENGIASQNNYHDFPILKFSEMPEIETIVIDSDKSPEGIGEPGVPSLGPALANAYFSATGIRKYSLPII